jgi:hypothetical protein
MRIADQIRSVALDEKKHCGAADREFYTDFYCRLLDEAINSPNLVEYTLSHIERNQKLLDNKEVTTYIYLVPESETDRVSSRTETKWVPETRISTKHSPLLNLADELRVDQNRRERLEGVNFSGGKTIAYEIFGMVAFLLATALRILKTSLELYGGLKSSKKTLVGEQSLGPERLQS